jgi:twitching motility two-component system response regulator PilG
MVIAGNNTINPIKYLEQTSSSGTNVAVEFVHDSVQYRFYLRGDKLLYATNSILSNGMLERHLKCLSHQIPRLKSVWNKLSLTLDEDDTDSQTNDHKLNVDLQKIIWLTENKYLNSQQLTLLGKRISQEVIESLLLIEQIFITNVKIYDCNIPNFCQHSLKEVIEEAKQQVSQWQSFLPEIYSPYQRPYLGISNDDPIDRQLSAADIEKLGKILRGFNFRELGALLNLDDLTVVKRLYPFIKRKTVILRNPKSPLNLLPQLSDKLLVTTKPENKIFVSLEDENSLLNTNGLRTSNKTYNIACVDDSLTVLNSIKEFLKHDNIEVFPINNAAKAMMLMTRIQPDLIFMDIGMPLIDGYKLCSLLRKNIKFKDIPIIMLTGNTGIINRAKAKMAGATDYMTKPFTQDDLLNIAFRYLSDN